MQRLLAENANRDANARCFGLRIESHLLQVAIATPLPDGRYRLEIDDFECSSSEGWLNAAGIPLLNEALATLADRHEMRRQQVAVSLDGDFCVTRVAMGTSEDVDRELEMLADRIPRYLQLGPGEKVTGCSRSKIAANVDYSVTGVVNRSLIQQIYDALRSTDIDVEWVEPSLVSIARLVGRAKIAGDRPLMIADGTGKQWDVGIACSGRLLLDYRPASANNEEAFRDALDGHITRLKRFCHRHRRIATGELNRLLICGSTEKSNRAAEVLGESLGIQLEVLRVPNLPDLFEINDRDRQSTNVPAVASVLGLLVNVHHSEVPDLLGEVRRAPDLPWPKRFLQSCWPILAASLILCISYGLVSSQRVRMAGTAAHRAERQSRIDTAQVKLADLTKKRELVRHLLQIEHQLREPDWDMLLGQVTQSLPDSAKLYEYRVEQNGLVVLDGALLNDAFIYEFVNDLRRLPKVTQVALQGTSPDEAIQGTRFVIQLTTALPDEASLIGVPNE